MYSAIGLLGVMGWMAATSLWYAVGSADNI